jgi:uncharacterized protein
VTRAVIDANVLVAAAIAPSGTPADVMRAHGDGRFELICSAGVLDELRAVLSRPKFGRYLDAADVARYCDRLARGAIVFDDPPDPAPLTPDPHDDYITALALTARAHVIVSGDGHLLDIVDPPVRIVTPRAFLSLLPG